MSLALAYFVLTCVRFVISWLIWPLALSGLFTLAYRSYKQKQLLNSFPLLAAQANSAFIWLCLAGESMGFFYKEVTGN